MKTGHFVSEAEALLLEAMFWFANLRPVNSTREVERHMARAMVQAGYIAKAGQFRTVRANEFELGRFRDDQERLNLWLQDLITGRDPAGLVAEVNTFVQEKAPLLIRTVRPGFRFFGPRVDGLEGVCAYGMALLLDDNRAVGKRLRCCRAPGCDLFLPNLNQKGRLHDFCNNTHRLQAWRAKQRSK